MISLLDDRGSLDEAHQDITGLHPAANIHNGGAINNLHDHGVLHHHHSSDIVVPPSNFADITNHLGLVNLPGALHQGPGIATSHDQLLTGLNATYPHYQGTSAGYGPIANHALQNNYQVDPRAVDLQRDLFDQNSFMNANSYVPMPVNHFMTNPAFYVPSNPPILDTGHRVSAVTFGVSCPTNVDRGASSSLVQEFDSPARCDDQSLIRTSRARG